MLAADATPVPLAKGETQCRPLPPLGDLVRLVLQSAKGHRAARRPGEAD
jgi:hypothetical protein